MEPASTKPSGPTWLAPASTEGICAGGPLKRPPEKIGTFVLAGTFVPRQHTASLKCRALLLLQTALSLDYAREELEYSSKITKYKEEDFVLEFLRRGDSKM